MSISAEILEQSLKKTAHVSYFVVQKNQKQLSLYQFKIRKNIEVVPFGFMSFSQQEIQL